MYTVNGRAGEAKNLFFREFEGGGRRRTKILEACNCKTRSIRENGRERKKVRERGLEQQTIGKKGGR